MKTCSCMSTVPRSATSTSPRTEGTVDMTRIRSGTANAVKDEPPVRSLTQVRSRPSMLF